MKKDKIALQLYSVRDDMQKDFYGTLKKVKEMGYTGVEFAGLYGNDPLEVKKMCEELGLIPISAHVAFAELLANPEELVECYKKLGCKYVVMPYLTPEYRPGQGKFGELLEGMKHLGEILNANGMIQQYHNHDFEFEKVDGEYALDVIYREVGPELLQTQIDTCWAAVGGVNPAEYLKQYAGRIPTVHLKDFTGCKSENMYALIGIDDNEKKNVVGTFEQRPVGMGVQDFKAIVEAGDAGGTEWYIVEQDNPTTGMTAMECAALSVKYLLENIAE